MSFTDHKITSFQHKIADLADQPTLPPDELKARFDACPEELRVAHNAVCDDAARLEARVEGIVVETFGDTIPKSMLSDELQDELDAKATQSALSAETAAREALDDRVTDVETQKCEIYCGTYTGNEQSSQFISLGFTPKAVLVFSEKGETCTGYNYYHYEGGLAIEGHPCIGSENQNSIAIAEGGFTVYYRYIANRDYTVTNSGIHHFIAFR